jgi:uncharacterized membrane protein
MNPDLLRQWSSLGANGLPYPIPIHPNLVHLTLGLFIVAIAFDIVAALFPIEKAVFKFLAIPATRSALFDVGWYNLLAAAIITFFTVAAGFFEISLAVPLADVKSAWGFHALETMIAARGWGCHHFSADCGNDRLAGFSTLSLAQRHGKTGAVELSSGWLVRFCTDVCAGNVRCTFGC